MHAHTQPVATVPEKESLLVRSVAFLFVALGLTAFLSLTHTWFYGVTSTGFTVLVDVISLLGIVAGVGRRDWRRTHLPFWHRLVYMLVWPLPLWGYVYGTKCAQLLQASTVRDQHFEACFRQAFCLWFTYLLLGGRVFSQLLGFSWWKMRITNVFALRSRP
jgi:hypothetical protein